MLYSEIVFSKGFPLIPHLPRIPIAISSMSREQLDAELQTGIDSMKSGRTYTEEEVGAMLAEEFGI